MKKKNLEKRRNSSNSKNENTHPRERSRDKKEKRKSYFEQYDDIQYKIFEGWKENEKNKLNQIHKTNIKKTQDNLKEQYGKKLFDLLTNIKKINQNKNLPNLKFNKILSDKEFLDLVKEGVEYAGFNWKIKEINKANKIFKRKKNEIYQIFSDNQILKDLKQNAIISYLTNKDFDSNTLNIQLLSNKDCTSIPLLELKFTENLYFTLNELKNITNSDVVSEIYYKVMKEFLPNFDLNKIKLKEELEKIIFSYNIYFTKLPIDVSGITIHTGNIYITSRFLNEYFIEDKYEHYLLLKQKIILVLLHEINHLLNRTLQVKKNNELNFLENSFLTKDDECLLFKSRFSLSTYSLPKNKTGNMFDFYLYHEFYMDFLSFKEANFFSQINQYKNLSEYYTALDTLEKKIKYKIPKRINKFKIMSQFNFSGCAFNIKRSYNMLKKKNENIQDESSESSSDDDKEELYKELEGEGNESDDNEDYSENDSEDSSET
jgi:hypothetical protein